MNFPVDATQRRKILKTLSKNFQQEIKSIYEEPSIVSEMVQKERHLKEAANKMIFGSYRAALPHYFYSKIRALEDARWRVFFTQRILVYHNHLSQGVNKTMGLDGRIASQLSEVSLQKSEFNFIPMKLNGPRQAAEASCAHLTERAS